MTSSKSRQGMFERLWADRHGISPDDLIQYRFKDKEGYRLPKMASHYRTFCDTLDSVVVELPEPYSSFGCMGEGMGEADISIDYDSAVEAIEAAGLKVAP